ncbi:MAG TPA: HNH endonuclease signature motif containing protein, partial [Kofleriaceae bacterium]|nr:HNH endonuclease signature motif containing protein [Kofleriaceae bacterium]
VLDRAAGRTEDQVKELVASLRPQPAQPDLFRKLPSPSTSRRGAVEQSHELGKQPSLPLPPVPPSPPPRATIEPIAPELHVLRVTVSGGFKADLQAVREALSHTMPGAGLEEVLHECIRVTLRAIEKRRQGAGKKTEVVMPRRGSPHVPAPIRHAVWKRDGAGGCTYVAPDGRRCGSRHRLQVHHIHPRGMGGPPTVDNLTLRCQAHNLYAARQDHGAEHIARAIRRSARASESVSAGWPSTFRAPRI